MEVILVSNLARSILTHQGFTYLDSWEDPSDGNSISIIDTAKNQRVGTIATGKGPGRIVLTPDGEQLVYNLQAGNAVGFADVKSRKQTTVIPLEGPPLSLSLSRDGRAAYSGVQSLDKVYVISIGERRVVRSFSTPSGAGPDSVLEVTGP